MPYNIVPSVTSLHDLRTSHYKSHASLVDITYISKLGISGMQWCISVGMLCQSLTQSSSCLRLVNIWCHDKYLPSGILESCVMILEQYMAAPWIIRYIKLLAPEFGDTIDTSRYLCYISTTLQPIEFQPPWACYVYDHCISNVLIEDIVV